MHVLKRKKLDQQTCREPDHLQANSSVHDFHKFGFQNGLSPVLHFHLACSINPDTGSHISSQALFSGIHLKEHTNYMLRKKFRITNTMPACSRPRNAGTKVIGEFCTRRRIFTPNARNGF